MVMSAALFLETAELRMLTGRSFKNQQIDALRAMGIPFYVNATGRPVVVRSVLEGKPVREIPKLSTWSPRVFGSR